MSADNTMKEQRDRFLAFSFASADLFIEVSDEDKITFTVGASRGMTGIDEKALMGRNWLDLFSTYEQSKMQRARELAKPGGRVGPLLVTLNETIVKRQAVLTAIKMPGSGKFYITLGVSSDFIAKIAPLISLPGSEFLRGASNFADAARNAIFDAKLWGQEVEVTFFDFGPTSTIKEKFSAEDWPEVQKMIGETLAVYSFGGQAAGEIAEGRYSFVHEPGVKIDDMKDKINEIIRKYAGVPVELEIKDMTVTTDFSDTSKREIDRALTYAVNKFEEKGADFKMQTLKSGYKTYLSENEQKLREFKGFIERVSFIQNFQAIVKTATRELSHYKIVTKFENGDAAEWIRFGEDAGLAPDFDMAVTERAINYIKFKAGGTRTKFSINLSSISVCDTDFMERFKEQIAKHKGISERLLLEIAGSTNIEDLEKAGLFLKELHDLGFKIALDDFSIGSTFTHYLENLPADFVKVDGRGLASPDDAARNIALIKNVVQTCKPMNINIIAQSIDSREQGEAVSALGIVYGQGDFYAPASAKPDYIPPKA